MNQHLGKRLGRPIALVAALLTLALTLSSPGIGVAAAKSVRTPTHTVLKSDAGRMKSYVYGTTTRGRTIVGSFTPRKFVVRNGHLRAVGKLNMVTRGPGKDRHLVKYGASFPVKRAIAGQTRSFPAGGKGLPASAPLGSCDVLNLVLGPLDLNVLGLEVHLKKVVLDIIATPAGGLLGQLLCGLGNLLNASGLLSQISDTLNQILAALRT
jgi:hypothetical protein